MRLTGDTSGTPKRRHRGFGLIEVLIAGFVLSLAVLGLSASLANGSRLAEGAREDLAARDAMRDTMARLEETPFDKVALTFQSRGFRVDALDAPAGDLDGLPGEILFEPGPEDSLNVYRVTLRVRWRGVTGERVIESVHFLSNVRGDAVVAPTVDEVDTVLAGGDPTNPYPTITDPTTTVTDPTTTVTDPTTTVTDPTTTVTDPTSSGGGTTSSGHGNSGGKKK